MEEELLLILESGVRLLLLPFLLLLLLELAPVRDVDVDVERVARCLVRVEDDGI